MTLALAVLAGCATPPRPVVDTDAEAARYVATIEGTRVEVLAQGAPALATDTAPFPFIAWVVAAPVGMVAGAPMSGGLSIIGVPLVVASDAWVRLTRDAITGAMKQEPLVPLVGRSLLRRVSLRPAEGVASIAIQIEGYGLRAKAETPGTPNPTAELCFCVEGGASIGRNGTITTQGFRIHPSGSTAGLPPPICGTLAKFAANDGEFLRQVTRETAAVVAAWTLEAARMMR